MKSGKRTAVILGAVFTLGCTVAYPILRSAQLNHASNFDALLWPGFIVSIPIYVLGGGVHGSGVDLWAWSVVPCNGIGYALVVGLGIWIRRR
jgi:hypothetical protein